MKTWMTALVLALAVSAPALAGSALSPEDMDAADSLPQASDKAPATEDAPPEAALPPAASGNPAKPDDAAPPSAPVARTAHAGALLQMFQTFCRGTYVGKAAILAAAERQGFHSTDASEMKSLAGFSFEGLELRANTVDGVRMLVAAGRGRQGAVAGRPSLDVCIVGVSPTETGAAGTFGHWAGVDPVSPAGAAGQMFMFVEGPDGRRSVGSTDPGEMRRHVRDGDVQLLLVGDQDGSTLAIYGVMRPEI